MGASVDYLHKDLNTGRLSFRRAYPPYLRPHIPGQPVQLKRSLGTKIFTDHGASDRFRDAEREYDRVTATARKAAAKTFDRLDAPMLAYLGTLHGLGLHQGSEVAVQSGKAQSNLDGWDWLLDDFREWRVERDGDAAVEHWGSSAERLLKAHGLLLDPRDTTEFRELCLTLNDAAIAASEDVKSRLHGHMPAIPPEPIAPQRGGTPSTVAKSESFVGVVGAILESPVHKLSETTKETSRTALRYFREAFSDIAPAGVTRKVVTEWLTLLVQKPRDVLPGDRKLKLPELVKRYEGQDVRRLSGKTVEQYVTALSARWRQAVKDGLIEERFSNPFSDRKVPQGPRPERKVQFSREELRAIFSLPIFTRGEEPTGGKGAASYWMPLLLLWTGARPEEIAQLVVEDVFEDADSSRWVLRITDAGTHPHKSQRLLKTSRTHSCRRTFPLPQALLDLNFLGYVDHVRSSGEEALFPQLRPKGKRNYLHAQWATWWGRYLRVAGILPPISINSRKPVREFRDVWATAARTSGLYRETMEYVMGHTPPNKTANDDYGDKDPLGRQIDMLSFAGLDMSGVGPWKPRSPAVK